MNNMKTLRWVKTAALLVAVLAYAAPAAAQEADLKVTVAATTATGNIGLGATGTVKITVANIGAVEAAGVTVTVDSSAWPTDQVITAISGCTPASKPATPTAATNSAWFPCAISGTVATEASVVAPATTNAKAVKVSVKYGVAVKASSIYDDTGARIESAWVCPSPTKFKAVSASAATTTTESVTANNTASQAAAPIPLWADVELTTVGPASIGHGGGDYTFTTTVKNLGPCTISTDVAVDDSATNGFEFKSAAGICTGIDGIYTADGSDYQYCDAGTLAPNATATATIVWHLNALAKDSLSSNQAAGMQLTFGAGDWADPNPDNNVSDASYVVTKSMGCSSVGGGGPLALLGLGLALLLRRRRAA